MAIYRYLNPRKPIRRSGLARGVARVGVGIGAALVFGALVTEEFGSAQGTERTGPAILTAPAREGTTLGRTFRLEVRDLAPDAAEGAMDAAQSTLLRVERALRTGEPVVDPWRRELLLRALEFCTWSDGAHGPLGGTKRAAWRSGQMPAAVAAPPDGTLDERGDASARECAALNAQVGHDVSSASGVLSDPRLDFEGFAAGFAVDRALETIRSAGSANARVTVGAVSRATGGGPAGLGWPVVFEPFPGQSRPVPAVALRDYALAIVSLADEPAWSVGGTRFAPYLDLRSGQTATGKVAVLVATETALDAEAIAVSLFVLDTREGEFRVGRLRPRPSILWLLGSGEGEPLWLDSRWSALRGRRSP